jgi:hypothetical protein
VQIRTKYTTVVHIGAPRGREAFLSISVRSGTAGMLAEYVDEGADSSTCFTNVPMTPIYR